MAMQEFYIRNATETEARGPYNLEQITSLAETGQVTPDTLYYDAGTEQWVSIGNNIEVKAVIFPEKKKLGVKKDVKVATLNKESENAAPITVNDMLAAAEGKTADTKDKSDIAIAMGRCAKIGMWSCVVGLLLAAAAQILPHADLVAAMDPAKIVTQPLVILGLVDVVLALLLALGVVSLYPFVRFRAALGLGFFGFIFWTQGHPAPLLAVTAGSVGLYLCTIVLSYLPTFIAAALTLLGMGGFAYYALMG